MKNIFKFMGLAMMASAMIVACGSKDDPENENPSGGDGGQTTTTSAVVTFKGAEWEVGANQLSDQYYESYGIIYYRMYKTAGTFPYVDVMGTATAGTYSYEATIETAEPDENFPNGYTYVAQNDNMDLYMIEYGEKTQIQLQQGAAGDWAMLSASMTINSFDVNTLTASLTIDAEMYDYYSWYTGAAENVEDAETAALKVKVNNYTFTK